MYAFRDTRGSVELAFTDRLGGVSAPPFDELNLAVSGPDDETAKAENHRRVMADFAAEATFVDLYQIHSDVAVRAVPGVRAEADGLVTDDPDLVLLVRAADCVPVLLADPAAGVVGAAHAGRSGMAKGIVPATVELMRELGATEIGAWIGPYVCGRCYEVPADLQEEVATVEPASRATTSWGTPSLDVGAGVHAQLTREGISVTDVSRCTRESADLYSHRRDGQRSGRQAGLIRLVAGEGVSGR